MKYPRLPMKPYAPFKPTPPAKQVEKKTTIGELTSQEDTEHSIESLAAHIQNVYPNVDHNKVRFSMEVVRDYGYYENELSTSITIKFYTVDLIDDPDYDKMLSFYEERLAKYKKDYQDYKQNIIQYHIDEKQYKIDLENWQVEQAKAVLAKHEEKKAGKSK